MGLAADHLLWYRPEPAQQGAAFPSPQQTVALLFDNCGCLLPRATCQEMLYGRVWHLLLRIPLSGGTV